MSAESTTEIQSTTAPLRADPPNPARVDEHYVMLKALAGALRFRGAGEQEILDTLRRVNQRHDDVPAADDILVGLAHRSVEQRDAQHVDPHHDGLRLRMKIWTDPKTQKRYLVPTAIFTNVGLGILAAYAMSDEDTRQIQLTVAEWNTLPFFFFKEDGAAPRAAERTPDLVDLKR